VIDQTRQSFHAVLPTALDSDFSPVRVSLENRVNDFLVLAHGLVEFVESAQLLNEFFPIFGRKLRGQSSSQAFPMTNDRIEFARVFMR